MKRDVLYVNIPGEAAGKKGGGRGFTQASPGSGSNKMSKCLMIHCDLRKATRLHSVIKCTPA